MSWARLTEFDRFLNDIFEKVENQVNQDISGKIPPDIDFNGAQISFMESRITRTPHQPPLLWEFSQDISIHCEGLRSVRGFRNTPIVCSTYWVAKSKGHNAVQDFHASLQVGRARYKMEPTHKNFFVSKISDAMYKDLLDQIAHLL